MIDSVKLNSMRDELAKQLEGCDIHELISVVEAFNGVVAQRAHEMLIATPEHYKSFEFIVQVHKDAISASDEAMRFGIWAQEDLIG